jgi:phospholipid-binding lipoprotein MlaA
MDFSRQIKTSFSWILLLLASLLVLSGCASAPDRAVYDPWESYNREADGVNREFDKAIAKRVAKGYQNITPDPLDRGITNFFNNLADVPSSINNLLQLKPLRALSDLGRFGINSTIGILGLFDVASNIGLESYKEDLGQTLGYWGVGETYFVIPFLGPSTARDFVGRIGDAFLNPLTYTTQTIYWTLTVLNLVDTRADLLATTDVLEEAAVDPYTFTREGYLQSRRKKIVDGAPEPEEDPFDEEIHFEDE